jgi:hypothetical protein
MNIFSIFKKKKNAHNCTVNENHTANTISAEVNTTTPVDAAAKYAEIKRSFSFAVAYAANMQGMVFGQEEMSSIMEAVGRAVVKVSGGAFDEPGIPGDASSVPGSAAQKTTKQANTHGFKSNFQRMDALLKLRYAMRINAITGYTEIAERKEAETEQVYHVVTGYDTSSIAQDIQCEDINMWKVDVSNYLESNKVAMYHPFLQYFELLPKWDGKDRVTKLAERVSSSATWVNGFHRWMLAVTAQWMGYALKQKGVAMTRANSVAPIIISQQQGWGKSTFCRMLMPEELQEYYTDSFDIKQSAACEAKLMEYGLINLDEFDQISSRRNAQLKNLMQMTALRVRRVHQKVGRGRFRLASFIGTSNSRDLLSDKSGSRRFLCVELEHPIDCETPIEYAQLYAQLKQEVLEGERYWFDDEEEKVIQENNQVYYKTVTEEDLFKRTFRVSKSGVEGARFLNSDQIFKVLKELYPTEMAGISSYKFANSLPNFATRVHTSEKNGYWVVRKES